MSKLTEFDILKSMSIPEQIRFLIGQYRFNQEVLAANTGCSGQHLTNVISEFRPINSRHLEALAAAMGYQIVLVKLPEPEAS